MPLSYWEQIHQWTIRIAGLLCLLIGSLGVLGWHLHHTPFLEIIPGGPSIRYNAALGFLLGGTTLLCFPLRNRFNLHRYLGLFMFAFGFATFIQMFIGVDRGLNTFFTDLLIGPTTQQYASNPSIITLFIFMFAGIAFILMPRGEGQRFPIFTILTLSVMIRVLGYFGLLSFVAPVKTNFFEIGGSIEISFLTSLGAIILGLGISSETSLLIIQYQHRMIARAKPYIWGLGFLFFSILITYGLYIENKEVLLTIIDSKMKQIEELEKDVINEYVRDFSTFNKYLAFVGDHLTPQEMSGIAAIYKEGNPIIKSLYLLDDSFNNFESSPTNDMASKKQPSANLIELAQTHLKALSSEGVTIYYNPSENTLTFLSYFITKKDKKVIVMAESDPLVFFQQFALQRVDDFDISFFISGEKVYGTDLEHVSSWKKELILNIHDLTVLIRGYPTPTLVHDMLNVPLIFIVFLSSLFFGLGASFLIYLFEKSKRQVYQLSQVTASLRGYQEKLSLAMQSAGLTSWTYDIEKDEIEWDENSIAYFAEAVGYHIALPKTCQEFLRFIHPEDASFLVEEIKKVDRHEKELFSTFRYVYPNGQISFHEAHATIFYNNFEKPIQATGIFRNVTKEVNVELAREQKEDELRKSEEKFRILVETTNDWVWATNANRKITFSNNSIKPILGYTPDEIMGTDFLWLIADEAREKTKEEYKVLFEKKQGWTARINMCKHKNGGIRWLESNANPVISKTGDLLGYRGTERDITERMTTLKMQKEFVAMVSHELRTPLTSIKGALALVVRNLNMTPEKIAQLLAIALSNCDRLISLVNDILNIQKLEAGKIEIHLQPVEVFKLIEDSVNENQPFAEKFEKELVIEHVPSNVKVFSDPARIQQVLSNLISNAVKFSPPQGRIYIKVMDMSTYVRFSVRDEGEGIPEEFQIHIFEKFMRANVLESSTVPGTGLGLNISKTLVQRLGGTINFTSKKNEGTIFYFDLPKYYDTIPLIHPVIDREKIHTLLVFSQEQIPNKTLDTIITDNGFACEYFTHFEDVRTALQDRSFGALILDLDSFNSDNINFLRRVCKTMQLTIPLIIVSSDNTDQALKDPRRYEDFPVLGWLKKPINAVEINEILGKLKAHIYAGKATILYVDNDINIIETVKTLLADQVLIHTALTLAEARQILKRESIDLILLAIYLPDGLGTELLPAVNFKTLKEIPVVIFSINEDTSHDDESVKRHLIKARTSNQELVNTVLNVIKSHCELSENT